MEDRVMQKLSYGLFVLTACEGGKDNGCIINTFIQAANAPNRAVFSVNKLNYTHDMVMRTGVFNVSVISEAADFEIFKRFGFQSGRTADKMAGAKLRRAANAVAYIDGPEVNAYFSGKVIQSIDVGSHTLFIADITEGEWLSDTPSATYAYYFQHIKPKPEEKAENREKKGWICTICGYIYEGEELPADFICPICKHPASDFKKL